MGIATPGLGGLVLDPEVARQAMREQAESAAHGQTADPCDSVIDREKQVLKFVAAGRGNEKVADLLDINVKTAMSHREHIMQELDLHSRTDLIKFALQKGVIRVD